MSYIPEYRYLPPLSYSWLTPIYDSVCKLLGLGVAFKKRVLAAGKVQTGEIIFDAGCGTGVFLKIARDHFPKNHLIGIDPEEAALAIAKHRLGSAYETSRVKLIHGYAEHTGAPSSSCDIYFSTLVYHHMPDEIKKAAMREAFRILKPGGRLVIADFGQTHRKWLQKILGLFENIEYLHGNLTGLIPKTLQEVGFSNIKISTRRFSAIDIINAHKSL